MKPTHHVEFASFSEFVATAENGQANSAGRISRAPRDEWSGGDFASAIRNARQGWKEGAERIEKIAAPILEQVSSHMRKPEIVFDVEGDTVDIGAYLTGNPEPFLRWDETEFEAERSGKFVHIVYNGSLSAGFTAEQLFQRGAAVATLIDGLEASGHRVTLDVAFGSSAYGESYVETLIRIKNPEDNLDMENIAFACAHAGMFRRLVFSVWEQSPVEFCRRHGFSEYGGYGRPHSWKIPADISIGSSTYGIQENPAQWVRDQLKTFGVHFDND